jgi:hypothetical protein
MLYVNSSSLLQGEGRMRSVEVSLYCISHRQELGPVSRQCKISHAFCLRLRLICLALNKRKHRVIIMICTYRNDYLTQSHEGACTLEKEQASLVQVQTGGCSSSAGNTVVLYSRWKIKAEVPSVVQIHMEVHMNMYSVC